MPTFCVPHKDQLLTTSTDYKEVARYIGYQRSTTPDQRTNELIEKACKEMFEYLKPQAVFEKFDLTVNGDIPSAGPRDTSGAPYEASPDAPEICFGDVCFRSSDLARNLKGCDSVYLMAATIGPLVDGFIRKQQARDPAYAAILQSTGAMYIEKVVDYVNEEIKNQALSEGKESKPRYSPGYGDVPLRIQKDFFRLLPCTRIGLTLMDTLIMAPEKSVTAFVGIC